MYAWVNLMFRRSEFYCLVLFYFVDLNLKKVALKNTNVFLNFCYKKKLQDIFHPFYLKHESLGRI